MLRLNTDPAVRRVSTGVPWHKFTIEGEPLPKQRPRKGGSGKFYTPAKTKEYEAFVGWSYKQSGGPFYEGFVGMHIVFYRKHSGRVADADNLEKSLWDGMENVAFCNDKQVVYHSTWRLVDRENPRTEVKMWTISQAQWEEMCTYQF